MAKKRPGLSKKTRFEVFKRDSFKCQYCGRTAPDVVLHADHVSPVSKGGASDVMNLVTSCIDCNLGKSDRALDDNTVVAKQRAQLEDLSERREQLAMMLTWRDGLKKLDEASIGAVSDIFAAQAGYSLNELGRNKVRKLIGQFGLTAVMDSTEAAIRQYIKRDAEGAATRETVEKAMAKLGGFLALSGEDDDVRQLFYVRGIMRRRFSYCPEWKAIKLLKEAYAAGADVDDLKGLAKECANWTQFTCAVEREYGVEE